MSEKKILSMQDIADAKDIDFAEIDVPEWGGTIRVGSMNAEAMQDFVEANEGPAKKTAGIRLIVTSLVDAEGARIGTAKDIQMLKTKSAKVINRVSLEILKLNGVDVKGKEALGNASGEAPSGASPSA